GAARSDAAAGGPRGRDRAGDSRKPHNRSRHAGTVVRHARSEPPVEAGAEYQRARELSRFRSVRRLVGIDLGTTNSAVAWVDASQAASGAPLHRFEIPQTVAPGEVSPRPTLPSFLYFPTREEHEASGLALPWDAKPEPLAGAFARDHGALVPARQVSSAKAWLSEPADGPPPRGPARAGEGGASR